MERANMLHRLKEGSEWDIVIIGGGATGLGAAVDAASRGYKTLLIEQHDLVKGTSSRSTKLVHGGVRYLQQGNISLIKEALRERALLLKNAPHVCQPMQFVIPVYSWFKKWYYGMGLTLYDLIAGKNSLGRTTIISAKKVKELFPAIDNAKLKGGVLYFDGQFDDARLGINLAQTAVSYGAAIINYCKVIDLIDNENRVKGIICRDETSGQCYRVKSKAVVNATGIFTDSILKMESPARKPIITVSQGIHIVIDRKFFPGAKALMVPATSDGRVLFAVPWHNKVVVGTTDTPVQQASLDPVALPEEIDFIIENFNKYLSVPICRENILSVFAGLRPLVSSKQNTSTSVLPRDHLVSVGQKGMITITGGKWTTYRKMAEEVVDKAASLTGLPLQKCSTEKIKIHAFSNSGTTGDPFRVYGTDIEKITALALNNRELGELIHPGYPYIKAQIVLAVRNEMALTVEDFLARRIRLLFLDASAAIACASIVAKVMSQELETSSEWINEQVTSFTILANNYLITPKK